MDKKSKQGLIFFKMLLCVYEKGVYALLSRLPIVKTRGSPIVKSNWHFSNSPVVWDRATQPMEAGG